MSDYECARCGGGKPYSWLCGLNGMFACCRKCSPRNKNISYSDWEDILGKLKESPSYYNYCTEHLRQWLHFNNWLYYRKDNPEISDSEYDKALRELQKREESEEILADSPTQIVGAPEEKPEWPPTKKCRKCKK